MPVDARDHLGLLYHVTGRYCRKGDQRYEDTLQDAGVALVLAARGYDAALGKSFASYAGVAMRRAIRRGRERLPLVACLEEDQPGREEQESGTRVEVGMLLERLPARERELVERRYGLTGEEMTVTELAESYGMSRQWVSVLLGRAMRRLRRWGKG